MVDLIDLLRHNILVLDGAMGTMIQDLHLEEGDFRGSRFYNHPTDLFGNFDVLNLTKPEAIADIHKQYVDAGAHIITTNTFTSTPVSQADFGLSDIVGEMSFAGAKLARDVVDGYMRGGHQGPLLVAGSMGPTNVMLSMANDTSDPGVRRISFDEMVNGYSAQLKGLVDGGADLILLETVFDTLTAKAALAAISNYFATVGKKLPVMVSGTISDKSGRLLSGQTPEAFFTSLSGMEIVSIGLNCGLGAADLIPHVRTLSEMAHLPVSVHPNAGLPVMGKYTQTPGDMEKEMLPILEDGLVNIIGGCCGTTPKHIHTLAKLARRFEAREVPKRSQWPMFSGLEQMTIYERSNLINVGERTNVAGSRKFRELIEKEDYKGAIEIARNQVRGGAQILDINMDADLLDGPHAMRIYLNHLAMEPEISKVPFMIDSSNWEVIQAGLQAIQGKAIVNSISLKEGEKEFMARAEEVRRYGAAAVVMAFDEMGQAADFQRKIQICQRAYGILTGMGFSPQDIIFDPNVLTIGTGIPEHANYALDFFRATQWIKKNLPGTLVSGGVSNVSFAFQGNNAIRGAMNSAFLYHARQHGIDMAIINPAGITVYSEIPLDIKKGVEAVIFNTNIGATDTLVALGEKYNKTGAKVVASNDEWRKGTIEERLNFALINGSDGHIVEDTLEAFNLYGSAMKVIEGPLMGGMGVVGDRFQSGEMFLSQVVKSAGVMKRAVAVLEPHLKGAESAYTAGTVVLATVKGDVHDIGKNIVGIVLECNGYRVIDLGVQVPIEKIIETAKSVNADAVGLSGLITPSLDVMAKTAAQMRREGFTIPLLIGGATTSELHTAVKIDPEYGCVIHVKDASRVPGVMSEVLGKNNEAYRGVVKDRYAKRRKDYAVKQSQTQLLPIEEARRRKPLQDWSQDLTNPSMKGSHRLDDFSIEKISAFIDWRFFYPTFKVKAESDEGKKLYANANQMLSRVITENWIRANGVFGIWPANSKGDDIIVYRDDSRREQVATLYTLRQQKTPKGNDDSLWALSDFIAPVESKRADYLGGFALTAGIGVQQRVDAFIKNYNYHDAILLGAISDRLVEAFAELLHQKVRTNYWGYAPAEDLPLDELVNERYQGIRPAMGYPACPDHSEKATLFRLLGAEMAGIELTESFAMSPGATVCGLYFAHPNARYFDVGKIGSDQARDYSQRKGLSLDQVKILMPNNL